jgi:hypothetical protein
MYRRFIINNSKRASTVPNHQAVPSILLINCGDDVSVVLEFPTLDRRTSKLSFGDILVINGAPNGSVYS